MSTQAMTQQIAEYFKTQPVLKAFKNISTSIGDALSEGVLKNDDGRKTVTANNGHFDFYEYVGCDLNSTFQITKQLTDNEEHKGI